MNMIKFLFSIVAYFIILLKKGVKSDFPCNISPFFLKRQWKNMNNLELGSAHIGGDVFLSEGCCFYDKPVLFGKVHVGRYTSINGPGTRICAQVNSINIGAFCSIASNVIIQEYNHKINSATTYDILSHICGEDDIAESKGPINIEEGVWIGSNAVVLSGVTIGRGAIIGAGAVVVNNIPPYSIAVGNPAKVVKYRFSEKSIEVIENSKWWLWDESKIKSNLDFFKKSFN